MFTLVALLISFDVDFMIISKSNNVHFSNEAKQNPFSCHKTTDIV